MAERWVNAGVPSLQDLVPDGQRWSQCNNKEIKCTINLMHFNHPKPSPPGQSMEKLLSLKPVLGAKKVEDCWINR